MSGTVSIKSGSESDLKNAVAFAGPVSTAVDASSNGFKVGTGVTTLFLECESITSVNFTVLYQWSL